MLHKFRTNRVTENREPRTENERGDAFSFSVLGSRFSVTRLLLVVMASTAAGCGRSPAQPVVTIQPPVPVSQAFDSAASGSIGGRVVWQGETPVVEPLAILPIAAGLETGQPKQLRPNPHAPLIDPATRGVGGAVVYLRQVDAARARPWDHAPVTVAMTDYQLKIGAGRIGFVRRGDPVTLVSRQPVHHALRADGATFFTLPFPEADRPLTRRFERTGLVELSSAATYFWMRGYLFVDDHPYYTQTAPDGGFTLTDVPAGRYELVVWLPNWREAGRDLDPEFGVVQRLRFAPPIEARRPIEVRAGARTVEAVALP